MIKSTEMTKDFLSRAMTFMVLLTVAAGIRAAEVVYRIAEYNKTTGEFKLEASGMVPKGAWAYFENEYGATTGNRYNQIPRNRTATLFLEGWKGCCLKNITLSMCSNNKSGQIGFTVNDSETQLYRQRPVDFASSEWFGEWVSKDLNVYVDISKSLDIQAFSTDECSVSLQGGTDEGSVYINAITIEYDERDGMELESPLGWTFEKMTAKSKLNDGDEVMIYRNGCAATDIDGMQNSHYLDAVAISSTSDVSDHDVLCFTLNKDEGEQSWTMTDQYGRKLGATGKQALAWDDGSTQWKIDLGYDGATIANTTSSYGTIRFNAPAESYARFNIYTSNSLPLPFLYRKGEQNKPITTRSISFNESEVTATLDEGHIALLPTITPTNTTDKRMVWSSSNTDIATVNGGFVSLHAIGSTTITATSRDGGAEASIKLIVTDTSSVDSVATNKEKRKVAKFQRNGNVYIATDKRLFNVNGEKM